MKQTASAAITSATCLEDLLRALLLPGIEDVDWSDLPVFGGPEPHDTTGIWSWDETRLLVGDSRHNVGIVSREDWGCEEVQP